MTIFIYVDGIRAKFLGQESRFTQITSEKNEFFKEGHHLYDILLVSFKNYSPLFLLSVMQQLLEVGIPIMSKLQDVFPLLEYTGNNWHVLYLLRFKTLCIIYGLNCLSVDVYTKPTFIHVQEHFVRITRTSFLSIFFFTTNQSIIAFIAINSLFRIFNIDLIQWIHD